MERLLNIIHYCFYLIDIKLHFLSNYINPFRLLYKIPFIKKRDERLGISRDEVLNNTFTNKEFGISIFVSGGVLIALIFLLLFSISNIIIKLLEIDYTFNKSVFIALGIFSFLVCYIFVFRKDKYLVYFEEFEKCSKKEIRKNVLLSILFVLIMIALFFIIILEK